MPPLCRPLNDVFDWICARPSFGLRMGRSVVGWLRRGNGGGWEFDGVQFLAHVGPNEALVHPVDFLAGVVDQLHHLGCGTPCLAPCVINVTRVE